MQEVHAPYRFVPLSKWVYMPDWAHLVSHDVPFKEGYSGIIEYTLTNSTPLCVGSTKDKNDVLRFARDPHGVPSIPGSSLKGMIRNVMEIASFGKFSSVDKKQFSYRDISSKSNYLEEVIGKNTVVSGWIKYQKDKGEWQFRECKHAKVAHSAISTEIGTEIKNTQSAIEKYKKLPLNSSCLADISVPKGKQNNPWAKNLTTGTTQGHFVFTNNRIKGKGKIEDYEFSYFFYDPEESISFDNIQSQVHALFANHDPDQVKYLEVFGNPDLGIPVFALITNKEPKRVHSFGFAKMPRVSYKNDTHDLIHKHNPAHMDEAYFDMAELIFGTLRDNGLGLKSRVTFADACPTNHKDWSSILYEARPTVLSSPKATFLGAYIEQDDVSTYNSYDKDNAKLSGWKRYAVRSKYAHHEPTNENKSVQSRFELLPAGHDFSGKIVFHNLKKEELAALVWCLTLNNSPFNRHSLGHAKPLGAGAVNIKINEEKSKVITNHLATHSALCAEHWVKIFTEHMNERFEPSGKWQNSAQIEYLLAVTDKDIEDTNDFSYLGLKEFQSIKNNKASLSPLEYEGKILDSSTGIHSTEKSASLAFCKGRLSSLFDDSSLFHKEQNSEIQNYELTPFEKTFKLISLMAKGQHEFTGTEKKKQTKILRGQIKVLKETSPTAEQAGQLISLLADINFAPDDVKNAIAFLEKIQ